MAQTEPHLEAMSRGAAARRVLLSPSNLIPFPVLGVLALARHYHFVAPEPMWVILGSLMFTQICTTGVALVYPPGTPNAKPRLHLAVQIVLVGLVVYTIGWGALLAVGFLCAAATVISADGSRYALWAMGCTAVTVAAGEIAIGLGWVRTMVPEPVGHGLAVLEVAGACAVIWILGFNQREKERVEGSLRQSERRFRALVQHASDIIMVVAPDGTVSYASPAFQTVLGYSTLESVGLLARSIMDPDDLVRFTEMMTQQSSGAVARAETRLRHQDGSWRWFEVTFTNLFQDPSVEGWVANLRDISERKQSEAALRQAQEVFRHAFDEAGIGMALVDTTGRILRSNEAMEQMLRYADDALVGMNVVDITHPDDRRKTVEHIQQIEAGEIDGYRVEKRFLRADGRTVWIALTVSTVRDDAGHAMFMIGQMEDITERKAFSDRLRYEAAHDGMTGLLNRVSFTERIADALADDDTGRQAAVLFIDLDHFKIINDSLGHAAGDDLLVTVSQRLRHALRPGDVLARFGGDEFVVLCTKLAGTRAAGVVAQRLLTAVAEPILVGTDEVFVTASIGIAVASGDDTAETLLRHADAAMYQAKHDGRARAVVFRPDHHGSAVAALKTGNDLHRALDRDEFLLHYQPIVALNTGRLVGFEALIRWNHPERGLLRPADFIAYAEETGLIVPIGAWALETACRQTALWQRARDEELDDPAAESPLTISVNLAARQVADRTLAKTVARIIDRTGIAASAVCLELTENTLMQDTASTVDALHALRSQGVHLSIDDFGTGYSSLSYLKRFPVEALKIDRGFIDGLGREAEDTSIVEAIIRLAHALELSAVAEGLETPTQLDTLRDLGCDFAQGYLIGRPVPAQAIPGAPGGLVAVPALCMESTAQA